jgi:hypothetical protein
MAANYKLANVGQYFEGQVGWVDYNVDTDNSGINSNSGDFMLGALWGAYYKPKGLQKVRVGSELGVQYFDQAAIGNLSITQTVVDLLGVVSFQLKPTFSVFGKAGVAAVTQNYELLRNTSHEDASAKFMGAIGLETKLDRSLSATLTANYIDGENLNAYTTLFEGHIASTKSLVFGLRYYPSHL